MAHALTYTSRSDTKNDSFGGDSTRRGTDLGYLTQKWKLSREWGRDASSISCGRVPREPVPLTPTVQPVSVAAAAIAAVAHQLDEHKSRLRP